jgi:hypothetical protein
MGFRCHGKRGWFKSAAVLGLNLGLVLSLAMLLVAWRIVSGESIDPRHVKRIKDGQTTKHEILLYFGEPQEIVRTQEGPVFHYKNFKDAPALPYRPEERKIQPQSDQLMVIDENKQIKKAPIKTEGKILRSTLTVRFKPDGETVMSHEYKEF